MARPACDPDEREPAFRHNPAAAASGGSVAAFPRISPARGLPPSVPARFGNSFLSSFPYLDAQIRQPFRMAPTKTQADLHLSSHDFALLPNAPMDLPSRSRLLYGLGEARMTGDQSSSRGAHAPSHGVDMRVTVAGIELANPVLAASGTFAYGIE